MHATQSTTPPPRDHAHTASTAERTPDSLREQSASNHSSMQTATTDTVAQRTKARSGTFAWLASLPRLGVEHVEEGPRRRRLLVLNVLALAGVGLLFVYVPALLLAGQPLLASLPAFAAGASVVVLALSHYGHHTLNRVVYFTSMTAFITVFAALAGHESGVEYSVFILLCLPFLVCDSRERWLLGSGVLLPAVTWVFLESPYMHSLAELLPRVEIPSSLHSLVIGTELLLIVTLVAVFARAADRAERRLVSLNRDLLERERSLAQAKSFQDRVMSSIHDPIIITDPDGTISNVNDATISLLQYERDELIGHSLHPLIRTDVDGPVAWSPSTPDSVARHVSLPTELLAAQENREVSLVPKSSDTIPALFSCGDVYNASGATEAFVCVARDIRDRKRAERYLTTLLKTLPVGVLVTNADGLIQRHNPTLAELFGYGSDGLVGESVSALIPRFGSGSSQDLLADLRAPHVGPTATIAQDVWGHRKDGTMLVMHASFSTASIEGETIGILAVADRTAQEEIEEERRQTERQLARSSGMAEVATGVLHNVRNVVNSINISAASVQDGLAASASVGLLERFADLVNSHAATPESLREFILENPRGQRMPAFLDLVAKQLKDEHAKVNAELTELRDHVRHVIAIVSSQQEFASSMGSIEETKLAAFIEKAIFLSGTAFSQKQIRIERECEEELVVNVDQNKLMQIVVNLLSNARHAIAENEQGDRVIGIAARAAQDDGVEITVSDNGVGIDKSNLERIFSHGFTTKPTGHGFGLHISALAAVELGGELNAESDGPGRGARFRLWLPTRMRRVA